MNSSGEIIPTIKNFFSVATDMVVIHDDLELEYGFCKLRNNKERGLRSHNGLRSIAHYLNNDLPYFLSVGIGRPEHNEEVSVFVLKKFTHLEMEKQQEIYAKIIYLLGLT
jgi:PTH1 family peptidyl-tRNA hydrolase